MSGANPIFKSVLYLCRAGLSNSRPAGQMWPARWLDLAHKAAREIVKDQPWPNPGQSGADLQSGGVHLGRIVGSLRSMVLPWPCPPWACAQKAART